VKQAGNTMSLASAKFFMAASKPTAELRQNDEIVRTYSISTLAPKK
jgi:hypothetical protein